jgi:hypothetical protein
MPSEEHRFCKSILLTGLNKYLEKQSFPFNVTIVFEYCLSVFSLIPFSLYSLFFYE